MKLVNESLEDVFKGPTTEEVDAALEEYSEASWKMDKFLNDEDQEEYNEIIDTEYDSQEAKIHSMEEFLTFNADDRMYTYFPEGGNIKEFATYIIRNN